MRSSSRWPTCRCAGLCGSRAHDFMRRQLSRLRPAARRHPAKHHSQPCQSTKRTQTLIITLVPPSLPHDSPPTSTHPKRFYLVMDPVTPPGHRARLVVVPKKRLPGQGPGSRGRERFYAFVEKTLEPGGKESGEGSEGQRVEGGEGDERDEVAATAAAAAAGGGAAGDDAAAEGGGGGDAAAAGGSGSGGGGDGGGSGAFGGAVISAGARALISRMGALEYETRTRGARHQGAARLLAEAMYVIGRGGKR
jgi:hypothetical protein